MQTALMHGYGEPIWITICIQFVDKNRHDESRTRGWTPAILKIFIHTLEFRLVLYPDMYTKISTHTKFST